MLWWHHVVSLISSCGLILILMQFVKCWKSWAGTRWYKRNHTDVLFITIIDKNTSFVFVVSIIFMVLYRILVSWYPSYNVGISWQPGGQTHSRNGLMAKKGSWFMNDFNHIIYNYNVYLLLFWLGPEHWLRQSRGPIVLKMFVFHYRTCFRCVLNQISLELKRP